jgi:hypothetical protein
MTHQTAKELVADRAGRPFGDGSKKVAAAEPGMRLIGGGERRHGSQDLRSMLPRTRAVEVDVHAATPSARGKVIRQRASSWDARVRRCGGGWTARLGGGAVALDHGARR